MSGRDKFGYRKHCVHQKQVCAKQALGAWFAQFPALHDWDGIDGRPGSIEMMADMRELAVEKSENAEWWQNELKDTRPAAFSGGIMPGQVHYVGQPARMQMPIPQKPAATVPKEEHMPCSGCGGKGYVEGEQGRTDCGRCQGAGQIVVTRAAP